MKTQRTKLQTLTLTAILIGMGILIPMVMPKLVIPPASYTLASHVPVMIAMFISPVVAVMVALGTALGFFLTGMPLIITLRALTHVCFAFVGARYIAIYGENIAARGRLFPNWRFQLFNAFIGLIHAVLEAVVVLVFYIGQPSPVSGNFYVYLIVFIGLGGFIHSLIDGSLAYIVVEKMRLILPKIWMIPKNAQHHTH